MIEKNNIQKILETFFKFPTRVFYLRELSRELKLSMPTILNAIKKLKKEDLVVIKKSKAITMISANLENQLFTRLKRIYNLEALYLSGLVDFLYEEYKSPQAIICFGSYSRGDDIERSDIDIAIISSVEKEIDLTKFEKTLLRNISIHIVDLNKISKEFMANLYNGLVLGGAL